MQAGTEGGIQTTGEGNAAEAGNYRRLSDALEEADVERRIELEAIAAREEAVERARAERLRKVALLTDIPDETKAGTVEDFMYKQGVQEILEKLDYDLIGLKPVKKRVREIASLLVVDKMRMKLGLETSVRPRLTALVVAQQNDWREYCSRCIRFDEKDFEKAAEEDFFNAKFDIRP